MSLYELTLTPLPDLSEGGNQRFRVDGVINDVGFAHAGTAHIIGVGLWSAVDTFTAKHGGDTDRARAALARAYMPYVLRDLGAQAALLDDPPAELADALHRVRVVAALDPIRL